MEDCVVTDRRAVPGAGAGPWPRAAIGVTETVADGLARLLADAPEPQVTEGGLARVVERLSGPAGVGGRVDGWQVLDAAAGGGGRPGEFQPSPVLCRRAIGLRAVRAGAAGRFDAPAPAVDAVLADAARRSATGEPVPWWASWWVGLAPAAQAVVRAEAVTWASRLWFGVSWDRLAHGGLQFGRFRQWRSPQRPQLVLRCRTDVEWSAGPDSVTPGGQGAAASSTGGRRTSVLVVGSGWCPPAWAPWLAWPALVAAVTARRPPAISRVVGWWPDSGQVRVLDIDDRSLEAAAAACGAIQSVPIRTRPTRRGARRRPLPQSAIGLG
jgi:hypothetical protein